MKVGRGPEPLKAFAMATAEALAQGHPAANSASPPALKSRKKSAANESAMEVDRSIGASNLAVVDAPLEDREGESTSTVSPVEKGMNIDDSYLNDPPCKICSVLGDDDKTVLCDGCDAAFHIFCLTPPLEAIPEGDWHCTSCAAGKELVWARVGPRDPWWPGYATQPTLAQQDTPVPSHLK